MNTYPASAFKITPMYGTGLQVSKNTWAGYTEVLADDGFGNLVLADSYKAVVFLQQEV